MQSFMLTKSQVDRISIAVFRLLRESGFHFRSYTGTLPGELGWYEARHPHSDQTVKLHVYDKDASQMSDPAARFAVHVELLRNYRRTGIVKPWAFDRRGGELMRIEDPSAWTADRLLPLLDLTDRRWALTRWLQPLFPSYQRGVYCPPIFGTC